MNLEVYPLESSSDYPNKEFIESFAGLSITDKRLSVKIAHSRYFEVIEAKEKVDKELEEVRNNRRLMSIPIMLIPRLIAVCNRWVESIGDNHSRINFESVQESYTKKLKETVDRFRTSLYGTISLYGEELDEKCKDNFKGFLDSDLKKEAGFLGLDAGIKELEASLNRHRRKTVLASRSLHNCQDSLWSSQLALLKKMEEMKNDWIENVYSITEGNDCYKNYKEEFYKTNCAVGMSESNEITPEIIEKARTVCTVYCQFYPKSIHSSDKFLETMNIRVLKLLDTEAIAEMRETRELGFDKSEIEDIISDLSDKQIACELNEAALEEAECSYIKELEGYRNTLAEIEEYDSYRQQRDSASENEYRDIWHVCKKGSLEAIQVYHKQIENGLFDINEPHPFLGLTLLHFAILRGDPKIVNYLMEQGADGAKFSAEVSREIPFFYTSLHLAAAKCSLEVLKVCLQRTPVNIYTKSDAPISNYSPLHMVIKPKVLFPNQPEAYGADWQSNAAEAVRLLLKDGAEIASSHRSSAFHLVIDEFISVCLELDVRAKRMVHPLQDNLQGMHDTFISIIDLFLASSALSTDELKKAVEVLSVSFKKKRMGASEIELLKKILNCKYFSTNAGETFLMSLSLKRAIDGTPQVIKNSLNRVASVKGKPSQINGSQIELQIGASKKVTDVRNIYLTMPARVSPSKQWTSSVRPSLVDLKEPSSISLQVSSDVLHENKNVDYLPKSPRPRIQSEPNLSRHSRPRSNDIHEGDQIALQFKTKSNKLNQEV